MKNNEIEKKAIDFLKHNDQKNDNDYYKHFLKEFSKQKAFTIDSGGGFTIGIIPIDKRNVIGIGKETDNVIKYTIDHDSNDPSEIFYDENAQYTTLYEKFSGGGKLDSIYSTGTNKQLWQSWTEKQKLHFLIDHAHLFPELVDKNDTESAYTYAIIDYKKLPLKIRKELAIHHAMGIYNEGGKVTKLQSLKVKISPMKKKLQEKVLKLQASLDIASEKARKSIQKNIDKMQAQIDYKPTSKELVQANKGKFSLEVPTSYTQEIYKKLWSMGIFPRTQRLNGSSTIIVNNATNLDKAYKVYSDIAKGEKIPALSKISKKL